MANQASRHGRLFRFPDIGYIGGVCAGFAEYLGWNLHLIRALSVLTLIFSGFFPIVFVYLICWYLMPRHDGRPQDIGTDPSTHRTSTSTEYRRDLRARLARVEQRLARMEECVTTGDYELRRELRELEP